MNNYYLLSFIIILSACAPSKQSGNISIEAPRPLYLADHAINTTIINPNTGINEFAVQIQKELIEVKVEDFFNIDMSDIEDMDYGVAPLREEMVLNKLQEIKIRINEKIKEVDLTELEIIDLELLADFIDNNIETYRVKISENQINLYHLILAPIYNFDILKQIKNPATRAKITEKYLISLLMNDSLLKIIPALNNISKSKPILISESVNTSLIATIADPKGYGEYIKELALSLLSKKKGVELEGELDLLKNQYTKLIKDIKPIVFDVTRLKTSTHTLSKKYYQSLLRTHGVYTKAEEMYALAKNQLKSTLVEYNALLKEISTKRDLSDSLAQNVIGNFRQFDAAFTDEELKESIEIANQDIEQIIFKNHLITLPKNPAKVFYAGLEEKTFPELMKLSSDGIPQMIPRLTGVSDVPFVLWPAAAVMEMNTPDFKITPNLHSISAHEGRPGHEMQFTAIQNISEQSTIRHKLIMNTANVEGWALYAEKMIETHIDPSRLEDILFYKLAYLGRIVRVITDYEINLGISTAEQGIRMYMDVLGVSKDTAKSEINRRLENPGRDTGYFMGRLGIEKLQEDVKKHYQATYTDQCFHDLVVHYSFAPAHYIQKMISKTQNCLTAN